MCQTNKANSLHESNKCFEISDLSNELRTQMLKERFESSCQVKFYLICHLKDSSAITRLKTKHRPLPIKYFQFQNFYFYLKSFYFFLIETERFFWITSLKLFTNQKMLKALRSHKVHNRNPEFRPT